MVKKNIVTIIAFIELLIGISTLIGLTVSALLSLSKKSPNVFIFVLISAIISSLIGIGLLNYKHWARTVLVFFSGYIILTKILIFANLLHFNGEMLTFLPASLTNYISIAYHTFIVIFFTQQTIKEQFAKK